MASGHGRGRDSFDARNSGSPSGSSRAGSDGELGDMDDAEVADLWVMDADTGAYRMRTPDELAAARAPEPSTALALPAGGRASRRALPAPTRTPERALVPSPGRRANRPAPRGSKVKKRLKWTAISLVLILVVLAGGAYGYYLYLNSRIKKTERSAANEVPKAAADEFGRRPLNILLIGSDSRVGKGNQVGGDPGHEGLADTTILMHLSADRSNATMVSIPRDTMVDRPACKYADDKKTYPASTGKTAFNETLNTPPGAPCTVATVERMLGVQVDHYLLIDFNGVKQMTKAVGGVPINLCGPINDPVLPNHQGGTGLVLGAGPQRLEGDRALQFLRARHAFATGSDLARIEAQKSFLMALAREVKSNAKWNNPKAVLDIAQAATGSLQVDHGLGTIDKLAALGNEIKKIPEKRMAFTTLPNDPYPADPDRRVQQRQPDAAKLWEALRTDTSVTQGDPAASPPADAPAPPSTAPPAAPAPAPVDPSTMRVNVRNTTKSPKAKSVAEQLTTLKYKATVVDSTSSNPLDNSVIKYPVGKADAAKQLAAAVGMSELAIEESTPATSSFELIIGADFPGLTSPTAALPGAAGGSTGAGAATGTQPGTAPAPVAVPKAEDLKLNTADNDACIATAKKK